MAGIADDTLHRVVWGADEAHHEVARVQERQ